MRGLYNNSISSNNISIYYYILTDWRHPLVTLKLTRFQTSPWSIACFCKSRQWITDTAGNGSQKKIGWLWHRGGKKWFHEQVIVSTEHVPTQSVIIIQIKRIRGEHTEKSRTPEHTVERGRKMLLLSLLLSILGCWNHCGSNPGEIQWKEETFRNSSSGVNKEDIKKKIQLPFLSPSTQQ